MKNQLRALALILASFLPWHPAGAQEIKPSKHQDSAPAILADLFLLRPTGAILTVLGTGLTLATSPMTALASIAPPHDAFQTVAETLIVGPAAFTGLRPLGEFTYQPTGIYRVRSATSPVPRYSDSYAR